MPDEGHAADDGEIAEWMSGDIYRCAASPNIRAAIREVRDAAGGAWRCGHWTRATADDWVTTAALGFLGTAIVLHVGVGLRRPFAPKDP